jgi:hypothetical protein
MKLTESMLRRIIKEELKTVAKNNSLGEATRKPFIDPFRAARESNAQLNTRLDQEKSELMANNALDMLSDLKKELVKAFKIVAVASAGGGAASTAMAVWLSRHPEFVDQIKDLISQASK